MSDTEDRRFLTRDEVKTHPWFEEYVRKQMAFAGVRDDDYEFYREKQLSLVYDSPSVSGVVDSPDGLRVVVARH